LALVNAAKYFGVEFTERTEDNHIILKYNGTVYKFFLLHIFEFNSNRKRMSVIIRDENDPHNKKIKLVCKGADSVITKRLDKNKRYLSNHEYIIFSYLIEKRINLNLEEFGRKGLRTLMIAEREISENEYKQFKKEYYKCLTSLDNRAEKIEKCQEVLEQNLILLGATAIEDCLQDNLSIFNPFQQL
jgi:phospholipid-transporting ATPase